MTGTGAPRSKAQVDIGKTFKRNMSGCIWGHGWCPKWGDSLTYGAGPRLSLVWGSLWEGERFVHIGSLALKRGTLLNENFQKYCKNYPRITCRWCSHGSPPSSSRTTVRIGNNLAEMWMILLTMVFGKPGQRKGDWSRGNKSRVRIRLSWVRGFAVWQGGDWIVVSHPV